MSLRSDIDSSINFVKSEGAESINAQFCFSPELPLFSGHFPGKPLLPGVMQIEMAKAALETHLGRRCTLIKVKKAKFAREVRPGDLIDMIATTTEENSEIRLKVKFKVAFRQVTSLSIILRQEKRKNSL